MVVALAVGCGADPAVGTGDASPPASTGGVAMSTTAVDPGDSGGASSSTMFTSTSSASSEDEGATFIAPHDWGGSPFECDLFAQDCASGHKCLPWANDGGPAFNATHCVPVVEDPAAVGEPCTVQDSPTSGVDDCDFGGMCWFVDDDLQGECTALCGGSAEAPECADGYHCPIAADGAIVLCLLECDPLSSACADDAVCVPVTGQFVCAPEDSDPNAGHGSPCEFINACPVGMLCVGARAHTSCAGAIGCCSTVCDVTAADDPCPALDPNQSCEPWYLEGMAPEGDEDVGVCALPV